MNALYMGLCVFVVAYLAIGCSSQRTILESPDLVLHYAMYPSKETLLPIEKGYRTYVKNAEKDIIFDQGFCAEYATSLALLKKYKDAFIWFEKEAQDYPLSKEYIIVLKKQLIPEPTLTALEIERAEKLEKERLAAEEKRAKEEEKRERERLAAEEKAAREAAKQEKIQIANERKAEKEALRKEKEEIVAEKRAEREAMRKEREEVSAEKKAEKEAIKREKAQQDAEEKAQKETERKEKTQKNMEEESKKQ